MGDRAQLPSVESAGRHHNEVPLKAMNMKMSDKSAVRST